jgi:hypothetical protein
MTGADGMHLLGFDLLGLRRAPPAAGLHSLMPPTTLASNETRNGRTTSRAAV